MIAGLPDAAVGWVSTHLGAPVVSATLLTGGVASQMHLVRTDSGREAVLRRLTLEPWRRFADGLLTREYDVQRMLQDTDVPAPEPIALDVDGSQTGDPALLMSRLPGAVDLVRSDADHVRQLATVLVTLHRFRPPATSWPREYESWAIDSKRVVPPWSSDDGLYLEAFERIGRDAPPYRPTFLHRDYHPGNVLRNDGAITGVVDWVETSTGPADLDVAHCASNLAGLHGAEVALAFREAYVGAGGVLEDDGDASRYWQLLDLVGFLPGPSGRESGATASTLTEVWRANGRPDLDVELTRRRREDLLRAILSG